MLRQLAPYLVAGVSPAPSTAVSMRGSDGVRTFYGVMFVAGVISLVDYGLGRAPLRLAQESAGGW